MRRLGERESYGAYARTLGKAVHYDWALLRLAVEDSSFDYDGLGTSWLVDMGRFQERSQLYPRDGQLDEIDARALRARDCGRVSEALERLREYDPLLHRAVFQVCLVGGCLMLPGRGLRHEGETWKRILSGAPYGGRHQLLFEHMKAGWAFIAVLAVEGDILRAAEEAGAMDAKALRWVGERGLLRSGGTD